MTTYAKVILTAAVLALPVVARADLEVHDQDGVSYVSGGVGDDERQALAAMSKRFNLKVIMATKTGHFMSDTKVRIEDAQGRALLETVAQGPLFFAQLKPGTYNVRCSYGGKEIKQTAHVGNGRQEQLTFVWATD